ncbi:MAG: GNAT family N-acetyltransferase [Bacteroidia bacterium]|nr:GNAT family N-acetyltransferase [Bacteroidia bacterium]
MLRKFTENDCHLLETWANSPYELFTFSGDTWKFPLDKTAVLSYIQQYPDRYHYIYELNGIAIGFGELILHDTETPRLSRLIISQDYREKGHGKIFISKLIEKCQELLQLKSIYLYVLESNSIARKCYEKCNFEYLENENFSLSYNGQLYPILKMMKHL